MEGDDPQRLVVLSHRERRGRVGERRQIVVARDTVRGEGWDAPRGQITAAWSVEPTLNQTSTPVAPVPLASSDTIRSSCSSSGSVRAMASANSDKTWYGVARSP